MPVSRRDKDNNKNYKSDALRRAGRSLRQRRPATCVSCRPQSSSRRFKKAVLSAIGRSCVSNRRVALSPFLYSVIALPTVGSKPTFRSANKNPIDLRTIRRENAIFV